jgi:polyferredoxin
MSNDDCRISNSQTGNPNSQIGNRKSQFRVVRWLIQLGLLGFFVTIFVRNHYGAAPDPGFFRFDPLLLVVGLAARTVIRIALPSLVVLGLTLVLGRFFCGWVCPLGTTIDLFDTLLGRKPRPATSLKWGKYLILLFLVAAAALGASFAGFFDPLVILDRSLVLVFYPAATHVIGLFGNVKPVSFTESAIALGSFLAIVVLGFVAPRFWCRNLCPLGGLFGLLAKFSLFKFAFKGECRECGACANACPTGAIDERQQLVDSAECIDCLACRYRCRDRAVDIRLALRPTPTDVGRREAILSIGGAVLAAPVAASLVHTRTSPRLVRPPGAIPEPDFLDLCLRCGRCLKACPSGCLQPSIFESGPAGIWTPRAVGRIGGCERNCCQCGQACPTGAIRNLPLEEKSYAVMGTAAIDRSRCIAWEQDKHCLVCDESCPYNAINAVRGPGAALCPEVDERICVGCGICESRCPVAGPAAIQVFPIREERKRTGWYKTPEKAAARVACNQQPAAEEVPSGFITE